MESRQPDMCRVCRSEGSPEKPLYHPCVCTGSIKYIHQDCLVQWLKYSKKEYCELCKHRYIFTPIYAPDMPKRLPIRDLVMGLLRGILRAVRYWLHYTLVALAWLGIVPLTACRIYRCLFSSSISSILTLPLDLLSTENLVSDCFQGCFIVTCTLCTFISLVWLREQILHGGGPEWLDQDQGPANHQPNNAPGNAHAGNGGANHQDAGGGEPVNRDMAIGDRDEEDDAGDEHEDEDNDNNAPGQDEANWNPMDWDRAAEELTWERLLGLDGSLLFMEHVFWVVSLNTLFILIFAFCPYHIGNYAVKGLQIKEMLAVTHFEGVLTTLFGYALIAVSLSLLHTVASLMHFKKSQRVLGLCYVAVKVSLLVVGEIGFFPLICGWWLDICSLNMFEATLKDREHSFRVAPGTSMFIHWLVGMVYIFYFASFILLLREVLRPGVLWFLRNLNDPDFNPIQEMIHLPVYRHARRFLASMVVFGTIVLVMLWLPVQCVRRVFPNFLPFHVMLSSSDTPVSELSLELLLLQVVLPALLEQGHTRQWLKALVRAWCVMAAWLLDLRSYLLGDVPLDEKPAAEEQHQQDAPEQAEEAQAEEGQAEAVPSETVQAEAQAEEVQAEQAVDVPDVVTDHVNSEAWDKATAGSESPADSGLSVSTSGVCSFDEGLDSAECRVVHLDASVTEAVHENGDLTVDTGDSGAVFSVDKYLITGAVRTQTDKNCEPFVSLTTPEEIVTTTDGEDKCSVKLEPPTDVLAGDEGNKMQSSLESTGHIAAPNNCDNIPAEPVQMAPELQGNVEVVEPPAAPNAEIAAEVVEPAAAPVLDNPQEQPQVVAVVAPADQPDQPIVAPLVPQALGDVHQAMMQGGGPVGFQPYKHPDLFALRLLCLLVLLCFTLFLASLASLLIPVCIGRQLMGLWTGETKIHELYTVACGLYACWVALRMAMILYTWIPQGWRAIVNKIVEWAILVSKSVFIAVILIGLVPLMLGLIFELVIVMPIRVPVEMTPVFFPWQDWALGVLHAKIITAATMMGPQWRLKRVIEQVYQQGLRNMNLKFIIVELCLPVVICLGLVLAVPHIIAKSIVPAFGCDFEMQNLVLRRIYPFILGVVLFVAFCIFQARQFRRLYEHIKNDKYLVGQRLVNYERHQN